MIFSHKKEFDYLIEEEKYKEYPELLKAIKEQRFTIKEVGVTHRWITHWHKEGLLLNDYEFQKWRKFDLIEYVWLKMIVQLRQFHVPLDTIKAVRDALFNEFSVYELLKFPSSMEVAKEISKKDLKIDSKKVDEIYNSDKVKKNLTKSKINLLKLFILDSLLLKSHFALLIDSKGKCFPFKKGFLEEHNKMPGFAEFVNRTHISVSISQILAEFISSKNLSVVYGELSLISKDEMQVLKALREKKLKSVTVKFNDKEKMEFLETVKEEKIDKSARFTELIMNKGYQDITIKTQEGNIVYFENLRRKKIKS